MGYFWDERVNIESISLGADGNSPQTDVRKYLKTSWQAIITPGTSAGNMALQGSLNGTDWVTLSGTTQAFTTSTTGLAWDPVNTGMKFLRVNIDNTSGSTGTARILFAGVWQS